MKVPVYIDMCVFMLCVGKGGCGDDFFPVYLWNIISLKCDVMSLG